MTVRGQNAPSPRLDYLEKVSGTAEFISDVVLPGMLHGKILRSPHPHARIRGIDTSQALTLQKVVAVLTGEDIKSLNAHWGLYLKDRPLIAIDRVRYVGDPVAVVIAEDELTAEDALDLIDVDYEVLPFVTDALEAMRDDAPRLHDDPETLADFYFKGATKPTRGSNVFQNYAYDHGDVEAGFAQSHRVFDNTFTFPMVFHYAMEPHCVVASYSEALGFEIWSCAQSPTAVQKVISRVFAMPLASIRVISPYVGGGFGGKASVKIDPLVAAAAWKVQRPVRVCLSTQESMLTCRRLSASINVRTGVRADGRILAKAVRVVMNGGAYADTGPAVAVKAANRSIGPYKIPNLKLESFAVYTNTVPGAAFRSIGGPQGVWASESQMDIIAHALNLDPVELRRRNMLKPGEHVRPDLRPIDVDMEQAMDAAIDTMAHNTSPAMKADARHGTALGISDPGILPLGGIIVRLKIDGSMLVMANSVEIGQGVREVLRRITADRLGQPPEAVVVMQPDTAYAPFDWGTGASRSSVVMGLAIEAAAQEIKAQLTEMAASVVGVAPEAVALTSGGMICAGKFHTFSEIMHGYWGIDSGEVIGIGRLTPQSKGGPLVQAPLFWETAAGICDIDLDEETGEVRLVRYVSVADVGRVLNRVAAEGQDEGATVQGLGHALSEQLVYEDGQLINGTMLDYHVPTIDEIPEDFTTVLIESGTGPGPGGARGMGEGAILPVAPAIANAIAASTGVRIFDLPLTPERVWKALEEHKRNAKHLRDGA
jgi:CO/xanthine dehydrogenase Mo-binding subunit